MKSTFYVLLVAYFGLFVCSVMDGGIAICLKPYLYTANQEVFKI
ncbi:hypothetical protein C942_01510 [Photobacterium marinum]|uniref:Uncharacterized protein n=1 Tax=Photobacterium marinum TaxID=1056511 RepID=L8JFG7_9GAMM|nr:hypothetical protein C942_01510 [Photobacterium marinum]